MNRNKAGNSWEQKTGNALPQAARVFVGVCLGRPQPGDNSGQEPIQTAPLLPVSGVRPVMHEKGVWP